MNKYLGTFVRGAAALVLALALVGCESGTGPTGIPDRAPETVRFNGVDLLVIPGGLRVASGTVHQDIGIAGGSIAVDGGRLEVPAGALAGTVKISMKGREGDLFNYRFGPSGLTFITPATLSIAVDPEALGVDPARLKIAGASDTGDDWAVIGGAYDEATGTVVAPVEHFSIFGLCLD